MIMLGTADARSSTPLVPTPVELGMVPLIVVILFYSIYN